MSGAHRTKNTRAKSDNNARLHRRDETELISSLGNPYSES